MLEEHNLFIKRNYNEFQNGLAIPIGNRNFRFL